MSESTVQPASINAGCKLWWVNSGTYEPDPVSKNWGVFWEPLDVRLPESAKPSCCYANSIVFYDRSGNQLLKDFVQHFGFLGVHPHLLYLADQWREVVNGRVEWHDGQWCMRWGVATNTRWASMMNAGFETWRAKA